MTAPLVDPDPIDDSSPQCPAVLGLAQHSRYVQRIERRYAQELGLLAPGIPDWSCLQNTLDTLMTRMNPASALRLLRHLVIHRLAVLDCEQHCPLDWVTSTMTLLAEFALDKACQWAFEEMDVLHGSPIGTNGQRANLWVVGMGKLGAWELNVSSDIDLIYIHDQHGETQGNPQGRLKISNQEYFGKVVKRIQALIGDVTEHGFVFRMDLALRPNGNAGPAVVSLDALEDYFQVQGREWERFAWLKSRVVAPQTSITNGSAQQLRPVVLPFVFRRYLDYGVFDALRDLHRQIREHAIKRSAGRPERANDVKLSRGGIREIEFIVQLLQLVRGGQFPELRNRSTLIALERLSEAGLMNPQAADALRNAYVFLRQVEHRIQYLDDQQTHVLPTQDDDLRWIAQTLGFEGPCAFLCVLDAHRELVATEFDQLLNPSGQTKCKNCSGQNTNLSNAKSFTDLWNWTAGALPESIAKRLEHLLQDPKILALRDESQTRLHRLIQRTLDGLGRGETHENAVLRLLDWLEPLLRRDSYLALLVERPIVQQRLLRLLGAARWPARYMLKHPGVIDELASNSLFEERFNPHDFETDLNRRYASLKRTGEDTDENLLDLIRRAHHAEVFRTLARDVEKVLSVEQVADDLSLLADRVLHITTRWCWQRLKQRHQSEPALAIIGYGKLGGQELGYGSDLDIVFVYDDPHDNAAEIYAALVRKIIHWLTLKTSEGDVYEIDTALRPNGNSGLLVTSLNAYSNYQLQRGSNTAWTWEHQAMTRARFVLGPKPMQVRFESIRHAVIQSPRDQTALRQEITNMRQLVSQAHAVAPGRFDLKHSPGGMMDAEFVVQYLVLAHAARHPALLANVGNIALLHAAELAGLLPPQVGARAAAAYRQLRKLQHQARLDENQTQMDAGQFCDERAAITAAWQAVFEGFRPAPS